MGQLDPSETARAMSQVLAPVFLISSIATLLGPMTTRYGRIIDRARIVIGEAARAKGDLRLVHHLNWEIEALYGRARLLRSVVIAAVVAIVCGAMTIFSLFGGVIGGVPLGSVPVWFFAAALVALIVGLVFFLRDFMISLRVLKADIRFATGITPTDKTPTGNEAAL